MLFDTGYSQHLHDATCQWPYNLYRYVTPIQLNEGEELHEQLRRANIRPEDIAKIFISHFHADHIGGLRNFPSATFIYAKSAYDAVKDMSGLSAVRHAFIPLLLSDDFAERSCPIDDSIAPNTPTSFNALPYGYDLFADQTAIAIPLPGHARGQMGLYLPHTNQGPLFFVADAAWHSSSIRERIPPHPIARLILDDYTAFQDTLQRLHAIHKDHPEVRLLPTHCQEVLAS
jgi:glyoxylase-like metal-dependent hydrolase (beta-lactamase superfamily II)